jgi:aflatoxin B1 aldehyde reductase
MLLYVQKNAVIYHEQLLMKGTGSLSSFRGDPWSCRQASQAVSTASTDFSHRKPCSNFKKRGKFVQLGLSNFTAFEVAEVVMICIQHEWIKPTIYQGMYNAITRSLEHELIPACKRYGLDVVVYNPIAGGLFSGKYKTSDIPKEGRYSDAVGKMGEMYRKRYFKDSTFEALQIIEPVVQKHGLTMVETALRWVVNHSALNIKDGNDGVIIGVSNIDQLDQNLKDCEKGLLPEEVVQALDKAWMISKPDTPNYWHRKEPHYPYSLAG